MNYYHNPGEYIAKKAFYWNKSTPMYNGPLYIHITQLNLNIFTKTLQVVVCDDIFIDGLTEFLEVFPTSITVNFNLELVRDSDQYVFIEPITFLYKTSNDFNSHSTHALQLNIDNKYFSGYTIYNYAPTNINPSTFISPNDSSTYIKMGLECNEESWEP